MHVRFAHAGRRDLDEFGFRAQLFDGAATAVTHRLAHAADQLEDDRQHAALVGHAAFDTFRHEFVGLARRFLEVAVGRTVGHRAQAAHAAVRFVAAALVQDDFARCFFGTGEHAAHHDGVRACRQCFRDVAREADAAVGDARHARAFECFGDIGDRGDLRHAHAGDDAGGADRARADADLDRIRARFDQRQRGRCGGDIAADDVHVRVTVLDPAHAVEDALRVTVGGVDHQHVHAGRDQQFDALFVALADADSGAHEQLALRIFRGQRVFVRLLDILDGDQAAQLEVIVDDDHALEAVLVHQALGFGRVRVFLDGDELVARRHLGARFGFQVFLETQVAVGDDADHLVALDHREAADAVLLRQRQHFADLHGRWNRDRIAQHARFEALDPRDFARLVGWTEILVDDTDTALLRHGDRQVRFGHGIHRGGQQRNVQRDIAGELGAQGSLGRKNVGVGRDEQHVIEGECFLEETHSISYRRKSELYRNP